MNIVEELDRLAELKRRWKRTEQVSKAREDQFKERQQEIYAWMERNGMESLRTATGTYTTRSTTLSTVFDMDAFVDWLKENDLYEEYIRPDAQKARLNEFVRDRLDAKQDLPPGVGFYQREYISTTER